LSASKGFTLIELLVVCSIVIILSTLILIDNNKFGGDVTLENLAYDIALTVRQTQVYGIAVTGFSQSGTNTFSNGYGMRFSTASPSASTQYLLFADIAGTGVCQGSCLSNDIVQTNTLQQNYSVYSLCVIPQVGNQTCAPATEIDILYKRPEPQAFISAGFAGAVPTSCIQSSGYSACYYEAQIQVRSPKGDTRTILVDATGQITVNQQ
jgi:prepilin-type N-terminal cleavage/methylation domain-containing protein